MPKLTARQFTIDRMNTGYATLTNERELRRLRKHLRTDLVVVPYKGALLVNPEGGFQIKGTDQWGPAGPR